MCQGNPNKEVAFFKDPSINRELVIKSNEGRMMQAWSIARARALRKDEVRVFK